MTPGNLDEQITIQNPSVAKELNGQTVDGWTNGATIWADVTIGGGREITRASQFYAEVDAVFVIRYRTDIAVTNRLLHRGLYYDILGIEPIGRKEGLRVIGKAFKQ